MRRLAFCVVALTHLVVAQSPSHTVDIVVEQAERAGWKTVDARTVFRPGQEIRFGFRSTMPGYLYVLNRSPNGQYRWMFPTADAGLLNQVDANRRYTIPASDGSFAIPDNSGFETIYWVLSPTPLKDFDLSRPVASKGPSTLIPKCDPGTLRTRGNCLDRSAGLKPFANDAPIPAGKTGTLTARELKISTSAESAEIRFLGANDRALVYELWIAHH